MKVESIPAYQVPEADYARLLGYPPGKPLEGRVAEVAKASREWLARHSRPWTRWRVLRIVGLERDAVLVEGGAILRSQPLARGVSEHRCDRLAAVAASAGPEVDEQARRLWSAGRPDEAYFLQRLAAATVEWSVADAVGRLEREVDRRAVVTQSPGYRGWDLEDQPSLLRVVRGGETGELPGPLQVLSSGALLPQMSKLSAHGLTCLSSGDHDAGRRPRNPCSPCRQPACQYRRRSRPIAGWRPWLRLAPG